MVDEVDRQMQMRKNIEVHQAEKDAELAESIDYDSIEDDEPPVIEEENLSVQEKELRRRDRIKAKFKRMRDDKKFHPRQNLKKKIDRLREESDIHPARKIKEKLEQIREEKTSIIEKFGQVRDVVQEEVDIKDKIFNNEAAIAGLGAGSVARITTQPLDVLKIRFQLQVERISSKAPSAKYQGIFHALRQIIKEESVKALWKGHSPAQFLSSSYGIAQWVTYEALTQNAWSYSPSLRDEHTEPFVHFVCGGIAGCMGTLASSPFDVIRTRLIGQGTPEMYKNLWHAAYVIIREEGFRTFYQGLVPALLQIAPYAGMQFMTYSVLTKEWKKADKTEKTNNAGWIGNLFCGMAAGLIAKSIIYPLDVVKKRLQVQGFHAARQQFGKHVKYTGLVHCFKMIYRDEGPNSLYKGLTPSCLKAATNTGLNFMTYEQIIHILHFVESDNSWFDF